MQDIKFCKDCKYIKLSEDDPLCTNPDIGVDYDLVTGKCTYRSCAILRNGLFGDFCGRDAKHFEPKDKG